MSPFSTSTICATLVSQRTGIINQIRAFLLERGIAVRQDCASYGRSLDIPSASN